MDCLDEESWMMGLDLVGAVDTMYDGNGTVRIHHH